jgi:hypothetical protein
MFARYWSFLMRLWRVVKSCLSMKDIA